MDNESIVEQIVRSLSFEVEAVPQDNIIQVNTTSKSAPLNVKIRVRKKEEAGFQHGVLSIPKSNRPDGVPERIRLVSSDQTIMSFNVVMEADFEKPVKKPRKNVFGVFKPTICLGAQPDEDEYAYLPNTTYKAEMNEESSSKSEGALKKFTLQKNESSNYISATGSKRNKNIFGKCKPGGCLDPPFSDDKYPYLPAVLSEQITTPALIPEVTEQTVGQAAKNKSRTSSIFSHKLLNWKRKNDAHDALENNVIKKETETESVLDLYQAGSLQTSTTYSNSIMTYPPTLNSSEHRVQAEKQRTSEIYIDSLKKSYNVPSSNYFAVPKMLKNLNVKNNTGNTIIIEDKGDIGDPTTHTVNTKLESKDLNDNAHSQDLVNEQKKNVLRTKDSVTDVRGAELYFMESIHSKESSKFVTNFEGNSTTDLVLPKLHIPVLTKTERIELDNMPFKEDQAQNNKIKVLTTPSSPVKISMTEIPAVIERIPMRAAQNTDNVIKTVRNEIMNPNFIDKVQLRGEIENDGKNITLPPKFNDKIENIWTPPNTDTSSMLVSRESTETEDFDDEHDLHTDALLRTGGIKSKNLITNSSIEEIFDANPATEFQTNNRWSEDLNLLKQTNKPFKKTGSASNISVGKSKLVNFSGSDGVPKLKYENMPPIQNDENKYSSKSIETLETKQELKDEQTGSTSNISVEKSKPINFIESDTLHKPKYENMPPIQNDENKYDGKSIETLEPKQELKDEQTGSTSNISVKKSKPINFIESDTVHKPKYENMPPIQNDENKYDGKSIETLETKQELKDEQTGSTSNISVEKSKPINFIESDTLHKPKYENMPPIQNDENKYDGKSIETLEPKQELKDEQTGSTSNISVKKSKPINFIESDTVHKPKYENMPPIQNDENKYDGKSIETHEPKQELKDEQTGSTSNISVEKSKPINFIESDTVHKPIYKNMPPIQNDENKYDGKSIETLETKQELKDGNKFAIKDLGDDVSSDILVKKDVPSETIPIDGDDIHYLWKNKESPLEKDAFIENKLNQKFDFYYKYNDTLDGGQEIAGKIANKIEENNIKKSENLDGLKVNAEFEEDLKENYVLENSQFIGSLPQSGNIEKTALLEGKAHKMITQMNEIESAASNFHDSLFVRKITSTSVMAESNKTINTLDVTHPVSFTKEAAELTQTNKYDFNVVSEPPLYYENNEFLNKEVIVDDSLNKLNTQHINDIDINSLDNNKINIESKESSLKTHVEILENDLINSLQVSQPYQNKDIQQPKDEMEAKNQTDQIKENNIADVKHTTFYGENRAEKDYDLDSTLERKNSYVESDFNLNSKVDPNIYLDVETMGSKSLEINGLDKPFSIKHHSNQAQVVLDRKSPFQISLAIQSYVDENNEVIVKSFDADKVPKRYPKDTVRVTKRSLVINDEINIPIDSENYLSILIKCNKQEDISEVVGHSLDTGMTRENKMTIAYKNDGNPVKRKVTIADNIERTLLAVYEDELLPLRNTISELKDHMETLTSQHMLLKGHSLVKKPRPRRIVPLYGKCGCIRR